MNVKYKILGFLKNWDVFGETHTFRINREKTYNSPVGGSLCFLFTIYSLYYIWWTFIEFISGENKTKEYDMQIVANPVENMTNHRYFSMAFCIRDQNYDVEDYLMENMDLNLFYTSNVLDRETKILNKSQEKMPLMNCRDYKSNGNLTFHQKQYWNILSTIQIESCKCMIFDEEIKKEYVFSSNLEAIEKKSFSFELKYKNGTDFQKVNDLVNKETPMLHVYFPEFSANLYDSEDPLQIKMHTEFFPISTLNTKINEILLGLLSFTDYYNILRLDVSSHKNKFIFYQKNSFNLNNISDNTLMKVMFTLSGNFITYQRKFLILEDYLANTLSYLWNLILLVALFSWFYNVFGSYRFISEKFFLRNKLIKTLIKNNLSPKDRKGGNDKNKERKKSNSTGNLNKIENLDVKQYDQEDPKKEILLELQSKNKLDEELKITEKDKAMISMTENIDHQNDLISNIDKNIPHLEKIEQENKIENDPKKCETSEEIICTDTRKNHYTIFFVEHAYNFLRSFCCYKNKNSKKRNKRLELYESTTHFYDYYMDVTYYLKTMVEFEIIKSIVLNKNQRTVLNKFRPYLKNKYRFTYDEKINELYNQNYSNKDLKKMINGLKNSKGGIGKLAKFF